MAPKKRKHAANKGKPGRPHQYLIDNFKIPTTADTHTQCQNGHVLLLYLDSGKSLTGTLKMITDKFGLVSSKNHVDSLVIQTKNMFCSLVKDSARLRFEKICTTVFVDQSALPENETVRVAHDQDISVRPTVHSQTTPPRPTVHSQTPPPVTPDNSEPPGVTAHTDPGPSTSTFSPPTSFRLRTGYSTPRKRLLRKRLDFLAKSNADLKARCKENLAKVQAKHNKDPTKLKHLKQTIKRKEWTITFLRQRLSEKTEKTLLAEKKVKRLKRQSMIKKQKTKDKQVKLIVCAEHEKNLKENEARIKELENNQIILQEQIAELKGACTNEFKVKNDDKTYSLNMRMLVYDCIVNRVPTKNIHSLLQKFFERTGLAVVVQDIPKRSVCDQMARELEVISDLHAAELAMSTPNLTLGFDSTTQEGVHVNSVHFTTETVSHVIGVDQLAGGTADDYEAHITGSVDQLARVYSDFHHCDFEQSQGTIITNISNTMTDRAAVNHATVRQLNAAWDKRPGLNELNCHLHPLEQISATCKSALKSIESDSDRASTRSLFGADCIAVNVVLGMNKMRYKDGKGDPKGFATFLDKHKLPRGLIPRYRGNRLHILFHICGVFIRHYDLFVEFLKKDALACGGLKTGLIDGFSSAAGKKEMCVLGLIGKKLTGPWMTTFYKAAQGGISHTQGNDIVKRVMTNLNKAMINPMSLMEESFDFFGNAIDDDVFKHIVIACPKDEAVGAMIVSCLSAVISVLDRQYRPNFSIELTAQLEKETKTARLHNMDAERVMGMLSVEKKHSPNATFCFISSKIKAAVNHVVDYLDNLDTDCQERIVNWSIGNARKHREMNRRRHVDLQVELYHRSLVKRQKKENRERKKLEADLQTISVENLDSVFPELEAKAMSDLNALLSDKVNVIGKNICHIWFDKESQCQETYYGKIKKMKKKDDKQIYVVAYWKPTESYDIAVDYKMPKLQLAADIVLGDLIFS